MKSGALLLLLAAGCTRAGQSVVLVDVSTSEPVPDLASVSLVIERAGMRVAGQSVPWSEAQGGVLKIGLYVDRSVSGAVVVRATGASALGQLVASAEEKSTSLTPGQVSPAVPLVLRPTRGAQASDGGAPDVAPVVGAEPPADGPPDRTADGPGGPAPGWAPPEDLQANRLGEGALYPQVAVHPVKGDAVAVFLVNGRVQAVRFDGAAKTWGAPSILDDRGGAYFPQLAMDAGSRVFAAWFTSGDDPALAGVWETRSDDGGKTWSPAARLQAGPRCRGLILAGARSGRARLVWLQDFGTLPTLTKVYSSYFDGQRWSAVGTVSEPDLTSDPQPSLALDDAGGGVLAWQTPDALGLSHLQASHFAGAALEAARELFVPSFTSATPLVVTGPDGKAVVLWWLQKAMGGATDTVADWFKPGGGWALGERLPDVPGGSWKGVMDHAGAVTVVFQTYAANVYNAGAVRYEPATGWAAPMPLETDDKADAPREPSLRDQEYLYALPSVDAAGNVQAVWRKRKASATMVHSLVGRRFVPGSGWQPEVTIAEHAPLAVGYPTAIATTDDGRSLVGFVYDDYTRMATDPIIAHLHVAWFR
jgi:hypothetical protein